MSIEVREVHKSYGKFSAVRGVSAPVAPGDAIEQPFVGLTRHDRLERRRAVHEPDQYRPLQRPAFEREPHSDIDDRLLQDDQR